MNTVDKLPELFAQGLTLQEIAEKVGVSKQRVHQLIKKIPNAEKERRIKIEADRLAKLEANPLWLHRRENRKRLWAGMSREEFVKDDLRAEQARRVSNKKSEAHRRGVEFNLGWADIEWPTHCPIMGVELNYFSDRSCNKNNSPSIDRVDPSKGYVKGNVAIICYRANRIKNDGTAEELRRIADYIDKHKLICDTTVDSQ